MIDLKQINGFPELPKDSRTKKLFLDSDGSLKTVSFSGKIETIGSEKIIASYATIEQLNSVLFPLFEILVDFLNAEEDLIKSSVLSSLNNLVSEINEKVLQNSYETEGQISDIKDEVSTIIPKVSLIMENKIEGIKEELLVSVQKIKGDIEDTKALIGESKSELTMKIKSEILGTQNKIDVLEVLVRKINIDLLKKYAEVKELIDTLQTTPNIIETVKEIKEVAVGGGISKSAVQKMIDAALVGVGGVSEDRLENGLDFSLTYLGDGKLNTYGTSEGTKTFSYNPDGTLASISGSGIYKNKSFTYLDGKLVSVDVI